MLRVELTVYTCMSLCTSRTSVTTGVLQGDVLTPFLYITVIDYLMRKATENTESGVVTHPRRSRRYPAISLNDLDFFADDIALLESSIPNAQAQLTRTDAPVCSDHVTSAVGDPTSVLWTTSDGRPEISGIHSSTCRKNDYSTRYKTPN